MHCPSQIKIQKRFPVSCHFSLAHFISSHYSRNNVTFAFNVTLTIVTFGLSSNKQKNYTPMRMIGEGKTEIGGSLSYIYPSSDPERRVLSSSYALYVESGLKKAYCLTKQVTRTGRDFFPPWDIFLGKDAINMTELFFYMLDLMRVTFAYLDTQLTWKLQNW